MNAVLSALPDAVAPLSFLSLWLFPMWLGEQGVRNAMLVMLVEFLLLHASVFLGSTAFSGSLSRAAKLGQTSGFMLLYALFIGLWAWVFRAWWPLLAFGWLAASKFVGVFGRDAYNAARLVRLRSLWVMGALIYVGGILLTAILPLPRLGISPQVQALLEIPVQGNWADHLHKVVAFGFLYFGTLALVKWRGWTWSGLGLMRGN